MTPTINLAAAGLMLAALALGACEQADEAMGSAFREILAFGKPDPAPAANPDVHAFRVGRLQAHALADGRGEMPNTAEMSPWPNTEEVAALLATAGAGPAIDLHIQPLLVRDGERVVLIDAGAGGRMETQDKLLASLRAAGVEPGEVTDVLISHAHADHVGGLADAQGALRFPNAVIRLSAPEWEYMQAGAAQAGEAALLAAVTPRVQTFEPGARITPSITAVPLAGHTPGHSGYEIASSDDRLLYIGDAMHSSVVSVQRPGWTNGWDTDTQTAAATRRSLLERGADQNLRIYGVHFPFPGVGRFRREGEGFVWAPER